MNKWLMVTLGTLALTFIYTLSNRSKRRRLPDGAREAPTERGWPILGIMPNIQWPLCHYLMELGEKHGNLFRITFGMRNMIVLNNLEAIKKCLKDDGDNFSGRWQSKYMEGICNGCGVLVIDGERWRKHRAFVVRVLRDLGLGKSKITEIIHGECRHLLSEIEDSQKRSLDFSEIMPVYTVNVISKLVMSKRYEREDPDFQYILKMFKEFLKGENKTRLIHFLVPMLDNCEIITKISLYLSGQDRSFKQVHEIFSAEIQNHLEDLDHLSEGKDFIDRFLTERSKIIDETGSEETFTESQLVETLCEIVVAGYDNTATIIVWGIMFLSKFQDVQRKMHDEIVEQIGQHQLPSTDDKASLPFTQAVLDEILRLSSVVPLSIFHRTFNDTVIDGIFIEKNSLILPNLYASHRDPTVWEKPFEFYPEHFLVTDEEGDFRYNQREELIPFGVGKRQCLGESLARAECFIFLVSIIQRFKVRFANDVSEDEYEKSVKGGNGDVRFSSIKDFVFDKYQ